MAMRSQGSLPVRWASGHQLLPPVSSGPGFRLLNPPRAEAFNQLAACRAVPRACQLGGVRETEPPEPGGHPRPLSPPEQLCFVQGPEGAFKRKKGSAVKTTFENQCLTGINTLVKQSGLFESPLVTFRGSGG